MADHTDRHKPKFNNKRPFKPRDGQNKEERFNNRNPFTGDRSDKPRPHWKKHGKDFERPRRGSFSRNRDDQTENTYKKPKKLQPWEKDVSIGRSILTRTQKRIEELEVLLKNAETQPPVLEPASSSVPRSMDSHPSDVASESAPSSSLDHMKGSELALESASDSQSNSSHSDDSSSMDVDGNGDSVDASNSHSDGSHMEVDETELQAEQGGDASSSDSDSQSDSSSESSSNTSATDSDSTSSSEEPEVSDAPVKLSLVEIKTQLGQAKYELKKAQDYLVYSVFFPFGQHEYVPVYGDKNAGVDLPTKTKLKREILKTCTFEQAWEASDPEKRKQAAMQPVIKGNRRQRRAAMRQMAEHLVEGTPEPVKEVDDDEDFFFDTKEAADKAAERTREHREEKDAEGASKEAARIAANRALQHATLEAKEEQDKEERAKQARRHGVKAPEDDVITEADFFGADWKATGRAADPEWERQQAHAERSGNRIYRADIPRSSEWRGRKRQHESDTYADGFTKKRWMMKDEHRASRDTPHRFGDRKDSHHKGDKHKPFDKNKKFDKSNPHQKSNGPHKPKNEAAAVAAPSIDGKKRRSRPKSKH